jgi:hypothetical protein
MAILMMIKSLVIKSVMLSIVINPLQFMGNYVVLLPGVLTLGISLSSLSTKKNERKIKVSK